MDQVELFAPTVGKLPPRPPSEKDRILDQHEAKHRAYLDRLRAELRHEFALLQRPLTTDDAWRLTEQREGLKMPADMSPMAFGGLFKNDRDEAGEPRWEVMGLVRSTREKARENLLRSWKLIR